MTSTVPYAVSVFSDMLTSDITVTSVPSSLKIPVDSITSVLQNAISNQSKDLSKLATMTNDLVAQTLEKRILLAQATINYYSILNDIATATSTSPASVTQAVKASAVMEAMFDDFAYFHGNIPSLGGNIAVVAVFSVILALQVVFGVYFHQWWFLSCWICGVSMEILGYAARIWCHFNMFSYSAYVMQLVCVTLAPCFLLAGMYYVFAQLTYIYGERYSVFRPMVYSYAFIAFDFFSICLQGAGGGLSASTSDIYQIGIDILIAGLAFQVFTMLVFQCLWYHFLWNIYRAYKKYGDSQFNPEFVHIRSRGRYLQVSFCVAFSASLLLVFVRSVYRVVEMSDGWGSTLASVEIYLMTLEALMMSLACALMTVCHPGLIYGRNSHIYIDKKGKGLFPKKDDYWSDSISVNGESKSF